jgi:hypothetical protein
MPLYEVVKRQHHRLPESREFNSDTMKVAESTVLKRKEDFLEGRVYVRIRMNI